MTDIVAIVPGTRVQLCRTGRAATVAGVDRSAFPTLYAVRADDGAMAWLNLWDFEPITPPLAVGARVRCLARYRTSTAHLTAAGPGLIRRVRQEGEVYRYLVRLVGTAHYEWLSRNLIALEEDR